MRPPKARCRLEHLTWEQDTRHLHSAPRTPPSDAVAALRALAGFTCSQCGKPLAEKQAYVCCKVAHCPICGTPATDLWGNVQEHCSHLVLSHNGFRLQLDILYARGFDPAKRERVEALLQLAPPAPQVTGGRVEYRVWTAAQVVEAFGLTLTPVVERLWGKDLRRLDEQRLHRTLLETCLHPEMQVFYPYENRTYEYYYCTDPDAALARVIAWAEPVAAGAIALQAMQPKRIVSA